MASKTLGRVACPVGCGHEAAQVKLKTDKPDDKTAYPYIHCAGCGIQLHTRNRAQAEHLARMTRPEKAPAVASIAPPGDERPQVDTDTPPPPKKAPGGLFAGFLMGGAA